MTNNTAALTFAALLGLAGIGGPALASDNGVGGAAAESVPGPQGPVMPNGTWYEFSFTAVGTTAQGCAPADPAGLTCVASSGTPTVFADAPPWTFSGPGRVTVTDAFAYGDQFEVFDSGISLGVTSAPATDGACGDDPVPCVADSMSSTGFFTVGAGSHSMRIVPVKTVSSGAAYFKIDSECDKDGDGDFDIRDVLVEFQRSGLVPAIQLFLACRAP